VRLRVRNVDTVMHGFTVPALGVETREISAGHQVVVEFTPEEIGEYDFYCTVWCSDHHLQMRGVIEVVGQ
jgi:cytochrome c oxidase subunit 2